MTLQRQHTIRARMRTSGCNMADVFRLRAGVLQEVLSECGHKVIVTDQGLEVDDVRCAILPIDNVHLVLRKWLHPKFTIVDYKERMYDRSFSVELKVSKSNA